MPYSFQLRNLHLGHIQDRIQAAIYQVVGSLTMEAWVTAEPLPFDQRFSGEKKKVALGEAWGKLFDCAWLHFTGDVPAEADGKEIKLWIDYGGEGYVADENGNPVLGLTTTHAQFSRLMGDPGKCYVPLEYASRDGKTIDFWVDAGNNELLGTLPNKGALEHAEIVIGHPKMRTLFYDFYILHDVMNLCDSKSARSQQIRYALYQASLKLQKYTEEEAQEARAILAPELAKRGGDPNLTVTAVGHSHMDLAWLWPVRETIRKGARTFSTVLHHMKRYPDYVFGASQPQLYQWMKDYYPTIYAQIKERIKEGRWEVQGAMWVEPDTNLPGGEALVRQLIYGKRFYREEFGREVDHLWEPDVFGYSGALPQILAKSGVKYFMTQKMSWNEINKFPHQTFWWEGIDGSRVLAHMLPEEDYNSPAAPRSIRKAEYNYFDSAVSDQSLILFGIGDGGGGPSEDYLERLARMKNLSGIAPVVQEPASQFFKRLDKDADRYVTWRGELYLEHHQGTLTTQGRTKRYNRKIEYLLRDLELSVVWALQAGGYTYPKADMDQIWRDFLFLQFHDILPGSSITRVYDESLPRYAAMQEKLTKILQDADTAWATGSETILVNTLSWPRTQWLSVKGAWHQVHVPAMSRVTLAEAKTQDAVASDALSASSTALENDLLRVTLDAQGALTSVWDKTAAREVLAEGSVGNRLSVYHDEGDAWDFPIDFDQMPPTHPALVSTEAFVDGPQAIVRNVYRIEEGGSTIRQDTVLTLGSPRLDFRTEVDWRESSRMLRVEFPVSVRANEVTCDIQFGTITRPTTSNTTWDAAKHEVAAHKWADLSEPGYGVALLNDCKYGYRAKQNFLSLNLLRSPHFPDPVADVASHEFTYSLYPHAGNAVTAEIMRAGYELNIPIRMVSAPAGPTSAKLPENPWIQVDAKTVVVEAVKPGEDGNSVVIRLYESSGTRTAAHLTWDFDAKTVFLTDLMEEKPQEVSQSEHGIDLVFKPFEILTLKVVLS